LKVEKAAVPVGGIVPYDPLTKRPSTERNRHMSEYQTISSGDSRAFSDFLSSNGQRLLPMVKLVEDARAAIDEVIDVAGRACIQAILETSAGELGGARSPGKRSGEIRYHGQKKGVRNLLSSRKKVSGTFCHLVHDQRDEPAGQADAMSIDDQRHRKRQLARVSGWTE
jgi:hypothetical protein